VIVGGEVLGVLRWMVNFVLSVLGLRLGLVCGVLNNSGTCLVC